MRYRSPDEDSARWDGFPFREGDIVISTRSKSGTTWAQMICALLVFQEPELPAPLSKLSPWLDWLVLPRDEVYARLEAQRHRRFIKTHTPLDGIPLDPRATYLVVARHPLDMAVSLFHQGDNLNRARMTELLGTPAPTGPTPLPRPLHDSLTAWIDRDVAPADALDSLPGVMWHLTDAWHRASPTPQAALPPGLARTPDTALSPGLARTPDTTLSPDVARTPDTAVSPALPHTPALSPNRDCAPDADTAPTPEASPNPSHQANSASNADENHGVDGNSGDGAPRRSPTVILVHYADLMNDLEGEMRRLANRLGIEVHQERWPTLVEAAGFAQMRARADRLAPDPVGIMKDRTAFFRQGASGAGRELLTDEEFAHYEKRAAKLAPPELLAWLHR